MKENYEITSEYLKDLKKLLDNKSKEVTKYDIAHASFRKNNAYWIIEDVDKIKLEITYLNGDVRKFTTYSRLMERVKLANIDYKPARRKFIKRYYKIVNALTKHRARFKTQKNTIGNSLSPNQIKALASQI
tara:strand:+ start:880 stop:1272 length:393 start_codon:yes stop_codon:yes gene_type:complete